jgi:hypothetical protein
VIALSNRIDELDPDGFGVFYAWVLAVNEGRYGEAAAMLPKAE